MSEERDWEAGGSMGADDDGPADQRLSMLCLWSTILGVLSVPLCCGFLTGIPAVITGHMGLNAVGDGSGELKGRGLAIAGLVMGYLFTVLSIIGMLVFFFGGGYDEFMQAFEEAQQQNQ